MKHPQRERLDYFLIWGHGLKYKEAIKEIIRKRPSLEILKIIRHKPKSVKKLVKRVYSHDYAPYWHLESKTKYLLKIKPEVLFIFVLNKNPKEVIRGEDLFKHIECDVMKSIKEEIREKFNKKKKDKLTEDHVIHISDNESQTNDILKYLGFKKGLDYLKNKPNPILSVPYYIPKFKKFVIRQVSLSKLYCNIIRKKGNYVWLEKLPIEKIPHFACLKGNIKQYQEYLSEFLENELSMDYSIKRFIKLSEQLAYLESPYDTHYVLVRRFQPDKYIILDGVHRAAILKYRNMINAKVAIIE